jgi:hypothetical protein
MVFPNTGSPRTKSGAGIFGLMLYGRPMISRTFFTTSGDVL